MDSGAEQSMCSCPDAFLSLRPCVIEVVGVSGSLPVFGVGTAMFVVNALPAHPIIVLVHNCLLCHGSPYHLLSVSQFQSSGRNTVDFSVGAPTLTISSNTSTRTIPLVIQDGLYGFLAEPLHPSDDRYRTLPRFNLTARVDSLVSMPTPASTLPMPLLPESSASAVTLPHSLTVPCPFSGTLLPSASTPLGTWSCKLLVSPSSFHRILAFPTGENLAFDSELRTFCDDFFSPIPTPPARRTYDASNPLHMADLSARFMGTGDERLRRTLELNRGLTPVTGRVPVHPFPQGKFKQGKTPRVSKGKVHHLHRASVAEAVFTDTFETRDSRFRYGQAFVDYRSRYGDVIPLRSRTQVGWAFGEFCCRNFTPLILIRDNISENKGGDLMDQCHARGVKSAYICPYTPQQDQAENYLGRVTTMASYAMVYAGAPLFFWRWAILCAVFIARIVATYYSRERIWSTPYTVLFGEPFPDASIVVPFGCGALVLLDKDDRAKFQTRCALLIFIHYATSHPLYTYAFYSPRSKRVLYRQDAIFLINTFPMRHARANSGLPVDGETLTAFRSPLSSAPDLCHELFFQDWKVGDPLPAYEDHATGIPLHDALHPPRLETPDVPPDWPRRYPNHPAFGPCSTVSVPVPPLFPTATSRPNSDPLVSPGPDAMDVLYDAALDDPTTLQADDSSCSSSGSDDQHNHPVAYSTRDRDKDLSRGMGNHLRWPHSLQSPGTSGTKRSRPTAPDCSHPIPAVTPAVDKTVHRTPSSDTLLPTDRVLRPRRQKSIADASLPSTRLSRVPVSQRWYYEPVPPPSLSPANDSDNDCVSGLGSSSAASPDAIASELGSSSAASPVLMGGIRNVDKVDHAWHCTNPHWSAQHDKFEAAVIAVDPTADLVVSPPRSMAPRYDGPTLARDGPDARTRRFQRGSASSSPTGRTPSVHRPTTEPPPATATKKPTTTPPTAVPNTYPPTVVQDKNVMRTHPPRDARLPTLPSVADPTLHAEVATFVNSLSSSISSRPPLKPRQPWMMDGDNRSDAEADADWHSAMDNMFAVSHNPGPTSFPGSVSPPQLTTFAQAGSSVPFVRFNASQAYENSRSSDAATCEDAACIHCNILHRPISFPRSRACHLNSKVLRRILASRESIFKYGIYLPRNDRDADASPERLRWNSGRQLEWLRLKKVGAFEYDWTKERLSREYPHYLFTDIGHLFYIYDYKFSGEHRVRLVFDGSRQGATTYDETYSPTVRPESIRFFHVYAVEMGWDIRQSDVPQAFLQAPVDHDIFVYPPRANVEFPGQLLKLRLALYGAKQSSALFFKLLNGFLLSLGFVPSTLDACFYKRHDAILIVHVDDMRCAGTPEALLSIHAALYDRFRITTATGNRFLGMDVHYDLTAGTLTMGMDTYIQATMDRFVHFDLSLGIPYREIVGCLLWIVLCVVGPELMRVKDLARRSNAPTPTDYTAAMTVLKRIFKRRSSVILFKRGFAGRELIPSQSRPEPAVLTLASLNHVLPTLATDPLASVGTLDYDIDTIDDDDSAQADTSSHHTQPDVSRYFDALQNTYDISDVVLPTTSRFTTVAYTDASFAVGEAKDSISGFVIFINGTPVMWGSMRQTTVADSTCSAEFVAASVCCKQLLHVENIFRFMGILCPKPYVLYTDSQASQAISMNSERMGKIRHIAIRYHLVRSMASNGDVFLSYCVTEDMIADLFTKILSGTAFDRLALRFYFCGI